VFHDIGGIFHHAGTEGRYLVPIRNADYASFASFSDPDGNGWVLQEVKTRLPDGNRTSIAKDRSEVHDRDYDKEMG